MSIFIESKPVVAVFNTAEQPSYISSRLCLDLGLSTLDHGTPVNVPITFCCSGVCNCYSFLMAALPCDNLLYDLFLGKEVLGRCLQAKNEGGIEFEEDIQTLLLNCMFPISCSVAII
jgi:hypothetical protein